VPLTFSSQLARAFPAMFSCTVCLHVCVWSAGRLVWVVFNSNADPPPSSPRKQPQHVQVVQVRSDRRPSHGVLNSP
jgi:hypothetical protein